MTFEPKSISDQIQCLAQLTGAPETFVFQVQELFTRKGISLESDAAPYLRALEEAFQREESIRTRAQRTQVSIRKLRSNADNGNKTYSKQIEQLKRIQKNLGEKARELRTRAGSKTISVKGDHRSFVTRQQNEDFPLVPGPDDVQ